VPASDELKKEIAAIDSVGEKFKTSAPEGIEDLRGLTASTKEDSDFQRSIGLESTVTNTFNVEVDGKLVVSRSVTTTSNADVVKVDAGPNVPVPVAKPPVVQKPKKRPNEEE
jgi:hypothetical protein